MQLARHLAAVLAPEIRVNSISPGGVLRGQAQSFLDRYCAKTPLKRMAIEEDFKGAFAYLASDPVGIRYRTGYSHRRRMDSMVSTIPIGNRLIGDHQP